MSELPGSEASAGWVAHRSSRFSQLRLLFSPPQDSDVLVSDEVIYYKAPKHVMSLAEPLVETVAVLIVVATILIRPQYEGPSLGLLTLLLSLLFVWRFVSRREWGFPTAFWAVIVGYVFFTNDIDPLVLAPATGLFFIGRLGVAILRWYRFEVRYLTNRRIIEATGFFGLQVASLPVARVTDLVLHRSTPGETFGYGNLRIESAGQEQSLSNVRFLIEPRTFHRLAVRLATKPAEIDLRPFIDVPPGRRV